MRNITIACLLIFLNATCYSQATNSDSSKELNDLKVMRQSLANRATELQDVINKLQDLKDSTNAKLEKAKKKYLLQKDTAANKQNRKLLEQEKYLKQTTMQLDKIDKQQKTNRKALKDVSDLIKEFDTKITELSQKF